MVQIRSPLFCQQNYSTSRGNWKCSTTHFHVEKSITHRGTCSWQVLQQSLLQDPFQLNEQQQHVALDSPVPRQVLPGQKQEKVLPVYYNSCAAHRWVVKDVHSTKQPGVYHATSSCFHHMPVYTGGRRRSFLRRHSPALVKNVKLYLLLTALCTSNQESEENCHWKLDFCQAIAMTCFIPCRLQNINHKHNRPKILNLGLSLTTKQFHF